MERWVFDFGPFAIRLHHWWASDDRRHFHDHAWWFLTFVLWGRYADISPDGCDTLRMGSMRYRRASHRHTVEIEHRGTWTLLITGRPIRRWGFWITPTKMLRRDKYFAENGYGHHPCDQKRDEPVRLRPDGSRI